MSSYKGHCVFNMLLALPALVAAQFYFFHPKPIFTLIFITTFLYTTLFMNPDLDLVHKIKLFSLRGLFSIPFRAYSSLFRHRGVSHSFFFGSLTRIAWLSGMALVCFFLIYQTLPSAASFLSFWKYNKFYILSGVAGICLADWCHLLLDLKIR